MDSSSNEIADIQRQMNRVRQSACVNVHVLVEDARALTDWRRYWRRHPWAWCGAAAVLGYCVVPSRRAGQFYTPGPAELPHVAAAQPPAPPRSPIISKLAGIAMGILMQQGKQLLAQRVARAFQSRTADPVSPYSAGGTDQERS